MTALLTMPPTAPRLAPALPIRTRDLLSGMSAVSAQDVAVITVNAGNVPTAAATATAQPTQTGTLQAAAATSTAINIPSVTPRPKHVGQP